MNHLQREFTARLPEPVPCPADVARLLYRQRIEAAIELLMAEHDRLEGDVDLEDDDPAEDPDHGELNGDDEPYLSAGTTGFSTSGGNGNEVDYENSERVLGGQGL